MEKAEPPARDCLVPSLGHIPAQKMGLNLKEKKREREEAGTQRKAWLQEGRGNRGGVDEDVTGILREGEQKYHS